jgi:hypothetical protein
MRHLKPRPSPAMVEFLESRTMLSVSPDAAALVSRTTLKLSAHSAPLGKAVIATATVKDSKHGVTPTGTVEFLEDGQVIQGATGPVEATLNAKGQATYDFANGNIAFWIGSRTLSAEYVGDGTSPASTSKAVALKVTLPKLKVASDGVEIATVQSGHGSASVAAGDQVTALYTGFLASSGEIFEYSTEDGSPLQFTEESNPEQLIPGLDQGFLKMKAGESRVVFVPSSLAYGSTGSGAIPANANLVFDVTVESISST